MGGPIPRRTRVLGIGGGPVGLALSGLLSRHGVANLVVERRRAAVLLDGHEAACRPVARANAATSFENLKRLGEAPRLVGEHASLADLERRLRSLGAAERRTLDKAIEAQRGHFLDDGPAPGPS